MVKTVKIEQHSSFCILWCMGWLFSIGFLKLQFWYGVLALLVWPYFLGVHLADQGWAGSERIESAREDAVQL